VSDGLKQNSPSTRRRRPGKNDGGGKRRNSKATRASFFRKPKKHLMVRVAGIRRAGVQKGSGGNPRNEKRANPTKKDILNYFSRRQCNKRTACGPGGCWTEPTRAAREKTRQGSLWIIPGDKAGYLACSERVQYGKGSLLAGGAFDHVLT